MIDSQKLALFIPVPFGHVSSLRTVRIADIIDPRSAIVGKADSDEAEFVTVDYEGNRYNSASIKTYADRARQAAGRHRQNYPTEARCTLPRKELRQVGWFDMQVGITLFDDAETKKMVASWLGVEVIDPQELRFSSL